MKKHKICIVGDGLSGLLRSSDTWRLGYRQIDLISKKD